MDCGGCDYIDIPYIDTLNIKLKEVRELLFNSKLKPNNFEKMDIVPSPKIFNYRNRCQLQIEQGIPGFYKKKSHHLIPIKSCIMLDERINEHIAKFRFPPNHKAKIELYIQNGKLVERLVEKKYDNAFAQINDSVNELIVNKLLELLEPQKNDKLLELYCGLGNFTFAISKQSPHTKITGIDIKTATSTKKEIEFINSDTELALKDLESMGRLSSFNKLLLDPPRSGAGSKVSSIISELDVDRIVYVSCNPLSLLEDAKTICSKNVFQWANIELYDMFPFTKYIESINLFVRKN